MSIVVTGGAGFMGSALCRHLRAIVPQENVIIIDKLTYAAHPMTVELLQGQGCEFVTTDICDFERVCQVLDESNPRFMFHLAAESHVDRSIARPDHFIKTNIEGTFTLLQASLEYWENLADQQKAQFRFIHISTDEVFGSLGWEGQFSEISCVCPSSPYSASKAASDHLATAWHRTYGLPTIITNSSNNYGPFQFPEKLIPLMTLNALDERPLPMYSDGSNVRDWLHVDDHAAALWTIALHGEPGERYCIGGRNENSNKEVIGLICTYLDGIRPRSNGRAHIELLKSVPDRLGHDLRYAIDPSKLEKLGWSPTVEFEHGLQTTIDWYVDNDQWWSTIIDESYRNETSGP